MEVSARSTKGAHSYTLAWSVGKVASGWGGVGVEDDDGAGLGGWAPEEEATRRAVCLTRAIAESCNGGKEGAKSDEREKREIMNGSVKNRGREQERRFR